MRLDLVIAPQRRIAPATERDVERLRSFAIGDLLPVRIKGKPRNGGNHRRFFALLQFIADNHPRLNSVEAALLELKIRAHHYTEYITNDGEIVFVPKSIDYDALDEYEFKEFFDKCLIAASDELVPDLPRKQLKSYIDGVVAFT